MPPRKSAATSHDSATGPTPTAPRRSSRGKSAEPQPITKNDKGKARALEVVEEKEPEDESLAAPGDTGEAPEAKERKRGMTLEEYFGPGVDLNQPLYKPHGKWAYTYGKDFKEVECIKRLSSGAQSEVWYNSAVVEGGERFDYIAKRWSVWAEWRGFFAEIYLYASSKHLRTLQGDCVPYFIGIHNVLGGYISFAMEPMDQTGWNEAHPRMSYRLKEMVVKAFEKLHAKGVLHNDVELRHILISDTQDKVMIIDFQESKSLNPCDDVGLRECTQADLDQEMNKVKDMIDWDGSLADDRRKLNRAKRNYRRSIQRDMKAGVWEEPGWTWRMNAPSWYREDPDHDPSDDEPATDDETAAWEEGLPEEIVLDYEEPESEGLGRRFTVPTEEERAASRWAAGETERLLLEQRRRRIEMEEAKKAAKEEKTAGEAQAEGETTKTSEADEATTVNEPAGGTPSKMDRPTVHFTKGASESPSQVKIQYVPFKKNEAPAKIEQTTPGETTDAMIHPPDSESTKRRSTSPPPEAPEPKAKKPKAATKSSSAKTTRSKSQASASDSSERRVTRASARAAEADLSSSEGTTPAARKTRSKSPTKKTSTSTNRSRRKAAPEPISTPSAPGTSKAKRKRASSPKPPPSPAEPRKASSNSNDTGPDASPLKSPLPQQRPKRARKAKAST
ncbi:hypothetical protein FS837_010015 [Tulasnella sp. UAMH 9824]|nr:hypothetical protein FS837_010015 [Tulasnella sp. UAMH 9824]